MIAKIIETDMYRDGISHRIIGIDVTDDEAIDRVINRDRKEEAGYTEEYIVEFNQFYKKLFTYLESDKFIASAEELSGII
jgi:deoxyadenosine/deoxycytidine kinase